MLTCKLGEKIINCFDGKYDKYTFKRWDEEKRLICPDCGKLYEYCHGEIVSPYFRHKEKSMECEGIYSEPETEEHIKGKMILYNWLLKLQEKEFISNVKLESYILETRQRPDLYFEKDKERYVIEFQCSPIATEYLERHRLYELAGINDIWILGIEKYNLHVENNYIWHDTRLKTIEKNNKYYLQTKSKSIIFNSSKIKSVLPYENIIMNDYLIFNIDNFEIKNKEFRLNEVIINDFISKDIEVYNNKIIEENKIKMINEKCDLFLEQIFLDFEEDNGIKFQEMSCKYGFKYCKHYYQIKNIDNFPILDFCQIKYVNNIPVYNLIFSFDINDNSNIIKIIEYLKIDLQNIINENIKTKLKEIEYRKEKEYEFNKLKEDLLKLTNKPLYLLFSEDNHNLDKNIRFKMIHNYPEDINELAKLLLKELKFIDSKGVDKYILMIPKKKLRESKGFSSLYSHYKVRNYKSNVELDFDKLGLKFLKYEDLGRK